MIRLLLCGVLAVAAAAGEPLYELIGHVSPAGAATITLFGATSPFQAETLSDDGGRFHFRKLQAGTYTAAVYLEDRGEARQTVEIGPGTADTHRRVSLTLRFKDTDFVFADTVRRQHSISAKELAVPEKALREFDAAIRDLEKHDVASAAKQLEQAVEMAPQFSIAWNELGTIDYQTRKYPEAEKCFRAALEQDPSAYEALVNLGGVLLTLQKLDEALVYNQRAVLARPNDALANSQLGGTYFAVKNFNLAVKYLEIARRIDPAHFSHPQLVLAEIHLRFGENGAAADDLEDFLKYHPDYPTADKIRENIARLRQ
ncbi:MAG TPA: tetratricopeptide repeat protein [Bryobacteraceae bacterium]|nr:tetratricopeptide repeat protein [Bryobacteraceae bacterium]